MSGPEVGAFGDDIAAKVAALWDGAARLADAVDAAYGRRGLDDGDRRRTARAALELVRGLQGKSGHDAVNRLAAFEAPTSAAAVGTSLRSAVDVTRSLSDTNWALLEGAAAVVGDRVGEALAADEIARPWDSTRRDLEAEATRTLAARRDAGTPEPRRAPSPGSRAGSRVVRDAAALDATLAEIRAALDALGSVDVSWQAPGPPA